MNGIAGRTLLIFIAASMVISIIAVPGMTAYGSDGGLGLEMLPDHEVIIINDDAELVSMATSEGWDGNGTADSPYVIENYDINATGGFAGIFLGNTTLYVLIDGCVVHDADTSAPFEPDMPPNADIMLYNATNVEVRSNTCTGSLVGICVCYSHGNQVIGNTMDDNMYSVLLFVSEYNTVDGNDCNDFVYGVALDGPSDFNVISNNTFNECIFGVFITDGSNNTIANNCIATVSYGICLLDGADNNTISGNDLTGGYAGIYIQESNNNTISSNDMTDSNVGITMYLSFNNGIEGNAIGNISDIGVYLYETESCTISGNYIYQCDKGILASTNSSWVLISGNMIKDSGKGVMISGSCWAMVTNNSISGCESGVRIEDAGDACLVRYNIIENNWLGVDVNNSMMTRVVDNIIRNNADGVHLEKNSNVTYIDDNLFDGNYCSIYMDGSGYSTIINNTMVDNVYGVELIGSEHNYVYGNLFQEGSCYAIEAMEGSDDNTFLNNAFIGNNGAGETYDEMNVQVYDECYNQWNDSEGGNYWSDWTSPDANGDGIVDEAYEIISGTNADMLPLASTELYDEPQIGNVCGMVVDDENNTLSGVTVSLSCGLSTVTDAYGIFSFENVTAGAYVITFCDVNRTVVQQNVTIADGETNDLGSIVLDEIVTENVTTDGGDDTTIAYSALAIVSLVAVAAIVLMYFRMRK